MKKKVYKLLTLGIKKKKKFYKVLKEYFFKKNFIKTFKRKKKVVGSIRVKYTTFGLPKPEKRKERGAIN